jgi:hypothetical protein
MDPVAVRVIPEDQIMVCGPSDGSEPVIAGIPTKLPVKEDTVNGLVIIALLSSDGSSQISNTTPAVR